MLLGSGINICAQQYFPEVGGRLLPCANFQVNTGKYYAQSILLIHCCKSFNDGTTVVRIITETARGSLHPIYTDSAHIGAVKVVVGADHG